MILPKIVQKSVQSQAESFRDVRLKEIVTLDKAIALLSTKDPLSFQQVQAMNQPYLYDTTYDPSEEGEIQRIHDREGERDGLEEQMTDAERAFLDDLQPGTSIP